MLKESERNVQLPILPKSLNTVLLVGKNRPSSLLIFNEIIFPPPLVLTATKSFIPCLYIPFNEEIVVISFDIGD